MKNKYSKEFLKTVLENKEYEVIGEIKSSNDKVLCKTKEGYLVLPIPQGIIRRNDDACIFSKYNPYTIYNINIWLKNNNIDSIELLSDTYINSSNKMRWKCKNCNTEFEASWCSIQSGKRYCNYCAKSIRFDDFRDYYNEIKIECDKRNYILLTEQINRSNSEFQYICNKHKDKGIQLSYYDRFINSHQGCKYCGIEQRGIARRLNESDIKELVEKKGFIYHGINYDNENKKEKKVNIEYLCPHHLDKGVQVIKYNNLLISNGRCKYCIGRERTEDDLQKEINQLNSNITILDYKNYSQPIKVKCDICGHEWVTTGVNLTQGHRCPNCYKSKFEVDVQTILEHNNINYISQYRISDCKDKLALPFDFYLPDRNILIEVDGEGHYIPIRRSASMTESDAIDNLKLTQYHDKIKTEYCLHNNIKLVRIPYWERDNLENYLLNNIN